MSNKYATEFYLLLITYSGLTHGQRNYSHYDDRLALAFPQGNSNLKPLFLGKECVSPIITYYLLLRVGELQRC